MIDLNTKKAKEQISNLLNVVEIQGASVKVFRGQKVVAQIVPENEANYNANSNLHPEEEAGYSYKTIGETLKGL